LGFRVRDAQRLPEQQTGLITALAFIVGGALGNLVDRILYGEVIDFSSTSTGHIYWPDFNLADSWHHYRRVITLVLSNQSEGRRSVRLTN